MQQRLGPSEWLSNIKTCAIAKRKYIHVVGTSYDIRLISDLYDEIIGYLVVENGELRGHVTLVRGNRSTTDMVEHFPSNDLDEAANWVRDKSLESGLLHYEFNRRYSALDHLAEIANEET